MKKIMLLAFGLFIALSQGKLHAQVKLADREDYESYSDSLLIKLQDGSRILISGMPFADMIKYNRADSLKTLFIADYDQATTAQTISPNSALVYYFVHPSGKRRLKAETEEYVDNNIDVPYEIRRLDLDLPKYQYHIYDLEKKCTISIYFTTPDKLKQVLGSLSINEAIAEIAKNKKEYRKYYRLEFTQNDNSSYSITKKAKKGADMLWFNPTLGAGLFGSTLVPIGGFELMVQFNNKYNVGVIKTGFAYSGFPLIEMTSGEVDYINNISSFDFRVLENMNARMHKKEFWLGLQVGLVRSSIGSFNNTLKWGVLIEPSSGLLRYSFDFYIDKNKNQIPCMSVKFPF